MIVFIMLVISLLLDFLHYNREANKVAHQLARLARFSLTSDWFEESLN